MNKKITKIIIAFLVVPLTVISAPAVTLSTNTAWTWMKGTTNANQFGTYGTQGVPATTNTPGGRSFPATWTDNSGAMWLFGGEGYGTSGFLGYLNDMWKLDPATMNWTWMKGSSLTNQIGIYGTRGVADPTNMPGGRACAIIWTNSTGTLWLFGGAGIDGVGSASWRNLNDLWKFDPVTTNWTWIKGSITNSQPGTYGTQGVPAADNTPGARRLASWWADGSGAMWLFGGIGLGVSGPSEGWLNDLWKLDLATTNWTWMKGANTNSKSGTYGTQGVPDSANTPGARWQAASWTDSSGAMWLFGGQGYGATGDSGALNDLWKFDPATTNWTWIKGLSTTNSQPGIYGTQGVLAPDNTPGARYGAVSWTDSSGAMWLFGGSGFDGSGSYGYLDDLWLFERVTTNWVWMKGTTNANQPGTYGTIGVIDPTNTPGGRAWSASWTDNSDAFWLFGGSFGGGYLKDLWRFDVLGGISLDTHALVFSATCQGANPASQTIGMTNIGLGGFTYTNIITYSEGASGWLMVLPADGTVALNGATVLTNQVNITGLGAGTYYAINQVTADDATNSPQTVLVTLTVRGRADPMIVDVAGNWYIWFSGSGYQRGGPWNMGVSDTPVAGDFDGDRYTDPAMVDQDAGTWSIWFSSMSYQMGGPFYLGVSGTPVAADFDGDEYADPIMIDNASIWYVWYTSLNYQRVMLWNLGVSGTPLAADFDGDGYADLVIVDNASLWYVWFSSTGYHMDGPYNLGMSGTPVAGDFDGDGYADPAMVDSAGGWCIWFTSTGYRMSGPYYLGVSGTPLGADFDGR